MKKRVLLGMTLMASLAFYSCTKEVVIVQEGGEGGIESPTAQDGQVLTLQVANSGDGLTTRAGRPLLSSQAKQDINHIDLFVVNGENKVVLKKTITPSEWANALDYTTGGHGKQLQISFKGSEGQKLTGSPEGTAYTIYAVAYKESSNYKTDFGVTDAPTTTTDASEVTFTETSFATILTANGTPADEIFAGKVEVKVKVVEADGDSYITTSTGSTKKDKPTLVLNRQVAGVTGYFTNLPAKVGVQMIPAKVRLVASGKSNKVHFTSMLPGETDGTTTAAVTNVVNGSASSLTAENLPYWNSSKKGYKVYEIELSEFFPQMKSSDGPKAFDQLDLDGDGFVGYKDAQYYVYQMNTSGISFEDLAAKDTDGKTTFLEKTWAEAIKGKEVTVNAKKVTANKLEGFWKNANKNQTLVAGSVFAGEFIIPFLQVSETNTFELQLLDKNNKILKTWNVQVPKGQTVGAGQGSVADNTIGSWSADTSTLIYNVYRNHLYSLGLKTTNIEGGEDPDPSDPDKPVDPKPNPDPDPDEGGKNPEDQPEDLSKGQDLLLNVNDNWEIIHQMEID